MRTSRLLLGSPMLRLVLVVVGLIWFLAVSLALCFPLRERGRLERRLDDAERRRQVQEITYPFYTEVMRLDRAADWQALLPPEARALRQDEVVGVTGLLTEMAAKHGFEADTAGLQVVAQNGRRLLEVALPLTGSYSQFGPLMHDLLHLPSLDSMTRISVRRGDGVEHLDLEFKLLLE